MSEPTKAELKVLLYIAEGQRNIARVERDEAEARMEAAEQQAARLNHDLTYLLDVAREVSDGEASRTVLRIAVDQIKLAAFRLAASQPAPAVEATDEEAWPRVEAVLSWFAEFIEEEPPIELPTLNQRARAVYAAFNAYSQEIRSGPYRCPRGGQAEGEG